jgi:cyclopropane-fatty-acyl-phospholipid synthase
VRITVKVAVAVSYLAQAPGALGLARAYVSGHLDVEGDMYAALARMASGAATDIDLAARLRLFRELGGPKDLIPRARAAPAGGPDVSRRWLTTGRRHSQGP